MTGRKFRFPNMGASELNSFSSWNTVSSMLNNAHSYSKRIGASLAFVKSGEDAGNQSRYNQFTSGIGGIRGKIGGEAGQKVDDVVSTFLRKLKEAGGHKISGEDLSKSISELHKEISTIASALGGVQGNILKDFAGSLKESRDAAARGGVKSLGGGTRDAIKTAFGLQDLNSIEEARKKVSDEIKETGKAISSIGIQLSLSKIVNEMDELSASAKDAAEKQRILSNAQKKVQRLASSTSEGADKGLLEGLSKSTGGNIDELRKSLMGSAANRKGLEFNNRLALLTRSVGTIARNLIPLKRTLDVGNAVFQSVNSKFNQFARMQMRVSAERGGFGRQVRGAGINYGHMMAAIGAGRSAGMEDRQVIGQMVGLQTQLAQARWGEGGLAENVGRWGISVYNGAGDVKQAHELMIDFSRKLRSLGSDMEKLQFLHAIGRSPEEMEYVANYEKSAQRMDWLKKNPHMMGVLDKADMLDESGFNAKVDAATKVELRRREILNQNAIEQGPFEALKRSLNPENWLFNDWSARQKGVQQAKGELAMERLTRVMQEIAAQGRKKGDGSFISAARLLSADELTALSAIAQKEIDNKGNKAGFAGVLDAYKNAMGMEFDVRTPIEKLQQALVPLTTKIAEWCEKIFQSLSKGAVGKAVNYAAENPLKSLAIAVGSIMLLKRSPRLVGGLLKKGFGLATKGGAKGVAESIGKSATKATEQAVGKSVSKTATTVASQEAKIAAGIIPDSTGRYHIPSEGLGKGAVSAATAEEVAQSMGSAAKGSGRVWWKPTTWFKGGGGAAAEAAAGGATIAGGAASKGAAKATEQAVEKGVTKSLGKAVAKRAGGVATIAFAAYDAKEAYDAYSRGDTAEGNRTMGAAAMGLAGAAGGAKLGAAIGTAIAPGLGTAIGGFLGTVVGGIGGALFGAWGADKINEALEVQGSDAERKKSAGFRKGDFVVDPKRATSDFINSLRAALKENDLTKAIKMLESKGLNVDVEALKDERFMKDDTFANQTLQGAVLADSMASYVARTKHAISAEDYNAAIEKDKYYQAARAQGVQMNTDDVNNAAMRQTGDAQKAKAPSYAMARAYIKNGWNTQEAMREEMAKVAAKHPDMSYSERKAQAEENLKRKHAESLTQDDYRLMEKALWNSRVDVLDYNDLVEEAQKYDIDMYGIRRNHKNEMMDAEGYLVDSNGNRVDKEGRHAGDEDFKETKVGSSLSDEGRAAYENLMEFRRKHPKAGKYWIGRRMKDEANRYLDLSEEERQQKTLKEMEILGIDTSQRKFSQKFSNEQVQEFRDFIKANPNMSASEALARFSFNRNMTLEEVRNFLANNTDAIYGGTEEQQMGLWGEIRKSKAYKAEQKKDEKSKKKEERTKNYREAIRNASIEDLTAALGGEEGQARMLKSDNYYSWDNLPKEKREALERLRDRAGRYLTEKDKKDGGYNPLHDTSPYKPDADEQEVFAKSRELVKEQERAKKLRPLAEYSDLRYMGSLIERGGIADKDEELAKHFGKQRVRQFRQAQKDGTLKALMKGAHYKEPTKKRKGASQMSREEAEASYRAMAQENFKQKEGESDEDYKKRIDKTVARSMEVFDTLHPQQKKKEDGGAAGEEDEKSGAVGAAEAMESAKAQVEQASQKMAEKGAAAESAAASAKNANGGEGGIGARSTENNVNISQNIVQNIQGGVPLDKDGMEKGTLQGAAEIGDKSAQAILLAVDNRSVV